MKGRTPDSCPHRMVTVDGLRCAMVARLLELDDDGFSRVTNAACESCCRCLAAPERLNPVIASLVYEAAGRASKSSGRAERDGGRLEALRDRVVHHLGLIHPGLPDRAFPPDRAKPAEAPEAAASGLRWAVGMLTAPRGAPRIGETIRSVQTAGFGSITIFAEPESWLPSEAGQHRVVNRSRRLGNIANFYDALATLMEENPGAGAIAMFQDDIRLANGAREWLERELWPGGTGIVSVFTPRAHAGEEIGWRLLKPGYFWTMGAQGLVIRPDVLVEFLADPQVIASMRRGRDGDDAVLGSWATRRGLSIAYHTPSLVDHVGHVSSIYGDGPDRRVSADAVGNVEEIAGWSKPSRKPGRIGVVGWGSATGIGYVHADLARHLPADVWVVPDHPELPMARHERLGCPVRRVPEEAGAELLGESLAGLDWVVFCERPFPIDLPTIARRHQVCVACVVDWEWLSPDDRWLLQVDLMICPTMHTYRHVMDMKARFGFGWRVEHVPWPVDTARFRFHRRSTCRRFLFVNGWGGQHVRRTDGTITSYARKGLGTVLEAAWRNPSLPITVISQRALPHLPPNVRVKPTPDDPSTIYDEGDVCVQPSHFEGIGLSMLECQAAGMPLVTTDGAPMNELRPLAAVRPRATETVLMPTGQPVTSNLVDPGDLATVLERLLGTDIGEASERARAFVERERSWEVAGERLRALLVSP